MRRQRWLGLIALLLAVGCALGTGYYSFARLSPTQAEYALRPGEAVEAGGVRYRLDSFTVADELPAEETDDPPVRGPAGSKVVLVVVSQTVLDRSVVLDDHLCEMILVAEPGGVNAITWRTESDVTFALRRPEALSCGDSGDQPLDYDVERPVGFSFVIPAGSAGSVFGRLSIDDDETVIALRP